MSAVATRTDAQRRADAIGTFGEELRRLADEGVLELRAEQQAAVRRHHDALLARLAQDFDVDRDAQSRRLSLGMRVASFLGALALSASVFFLFYQFWGWFDTIAQVTILTGAAVAGFLAVFWIRTRDSSGYFAKLAALVAFACFVLNIAMLGRIFNITPSDNALLPWAALALLFAYAFDLRLLLVAGIACVVAFVAARVGTSRGLYWLYFGERPENFFLPALLLLVIPLRIRHERFTGFAATYRVCALLTLFLPVLVLANWGRTSYLDADPGLIEAAYQTVGFVGTAAAVWWGVRRGWQDMVNTATALFVVFLYTKFFDWWWHSMPKYLFFFLLGLTAILLLLILRRLRAARPAAGGETS